MRTGSAKFAQQTTHSFALLNEHRPSQMTLTLHFRFSSALSVVLTVGYWLFALNSYNSAHDSSLTRVLLSIAV